MKGVLVKLAEVGAAVIGLIPALLILLILYGAIFYGPEYVGRVLAWRESTYDVYMDGFPSTPLMAAPEPFFFDEQPDEERVSGLFESILEADNFDSFLQEMDTQAFIVIQDDAIVYENYFNDFQRESMMTSYSVAKSFTSALIGIAIEQGYINSVDDPITDYLPELAERDPRFKDITIRHLLLMASGFEFKAMRPGLFNGDDPLSAYYPDQRYAALEFTKIVDQPGEYFLYNKYHPQLLGLILERVTGVRVTEFMQQNLWDPIGMEFDGSWSIDSEESDFEKMEAGLNARAIDFAKFGRLFLENREWEGEQVIPAEWVAESTSVDLSTHDESYYPDDYGQLVYDTMGGYYKYMWYGFIRGEDGYDFAAEGDRGQIIYVAPHKDLIIIRNGTAYGIPMEDWIEAMYEFAGEF